MAENASERAHASLGQWSNWGDVAQKAMVARLIGCSIANSTGYNYAGHFKMWELYRSLSCLIPYLGANEVDLGKDEDRLLSY